MKIILSILFVIILNYFTSYSDWEMVHTGPESLSSYVQSGDNLILFGNKGKIENFNLSLSDFGILADDNPNFSIQGAFITNEKIFMSKMNMNSGKSQITTSTDYGKSWNIFSPELDNYSFFMNDGLCIGQDTCFFVGMNLNVKGYLIYTYDGGKTVKEKIFQDNEYINSITSCKYVTGKINGHNIYSTKLFLSHTGDKIYLSNDLGVSWTDNVALNYISSNKPISLIEFKDEFGIAFNSYGDIFISTTAGVNWIKTNSFFNSNQPNIAYFQVYFHLNDIFVTGNDYTSKSAFILNSKDNGNNWNKLYEYNEMLKGSFIFDKYLYSISNSGKVLRTEFKSVSVNDNINENNNNYLSKVAENRILNTNINLEEYTTSSFGVTDFLGKKIDLDNFKVLSQNPFRIEIKSNVPNGVYYLLMNNEINKKVIKFLVF